MNNERIELVLNNVSAGEIKRVYATLEKYLKIDDYVVKPNNKSIIINNLNIIEDAKRIIKSVDEKILIVEKKVKNVYRYIYYLENLDCANCASKIERICSRNIDCEQVIIDFATLKIVIESTKNYEEDELQLLIQECAEMVDPRIDTKKTLNKKKIQDYRISKKEKLLFVIGIGIFLFVFLFKNIVKFGVHIDEFWLYIVIYAGYIPAYIILAKDILFGAFKNLKNGRFFDEMFLMALATVTALCVGYYDEALFLIIFYKIGEFCQQYAINYSRKSIASLADIKADKAVLDINGQKLEMEAEGVVVGDILYVTPGERIALDGTVEEGVGLIDTQAITGESNPVEVKPGDEVLSGVVVIDGTIKVKVTKSYENSMAAKILGVVENASSLKSKSETLISKFAKYYTPIIVFLSIIIAVFLPLTNIDKYTLDWAGYKESLRVAMIFLVVSCPCALVISIPLGFFGGIGCASKNGILVKGSNYLEALNDIKAIIFDKTGTLTKGNFSVKTVKSISDYSDDDILRYAALAEVTSNHVIAQSIIRTYGKPIDSSMVTPIQTLDKRGILVKIGDNKVALGRRQFIETMKVKIPQTIEEPECLIMAINDKVVGYICIEDEIREDAKDIVKYLKDHGVKKTIMLTGDSEKVAKDVAQSLEIDEYYADMNPLQKVRTLLKIKRKYPEKKVAFVGDGLNDAPVISVADIGIALGGFGSDATTQIADIVLLNDDLSKVVTSMKIARRTKKIVIENIVLALLVKLLFLVLAPLNIINEILIYGAIFADVGVSLLAILNSLRAMKAGVK